MRLPTTDLRAGPAPLTLVVGMTASCPMDAPEAANLALVHEYLAALGAGEAGSALERFFTPDATQQEFPNRLNPDGGSSDLAAIVARSEQGRYLLRSQEYRVRSAVANGDTIAVEADWAGTLAIAVAGLPAGGTMRAHFAMFFELADGRIRRQRNYDCFEPW